MGWGWCEWGGGGGRGVLGRVGGWGGGGGGGGSEGGRGGEAGGRGEGRLTGADVGVSSCLVVSHSDVSQVNGGGRSDWAW